ncbi:MAG: NAD-dependent epimerase/dehydratase family protein [Deltaproteobacteria bacterium]|nr:NAD-dependent epimerase/dehydratase family protein [Deltaproteobacteria bacterium]
MKALVTGGAGLVGSSIIPRLLARGADVLCVDNLTLGTRKHLEEFSSHPAFRFEEWDVSARDWHKKLGGGARFDLCVHLAANSDISLGHRHPEMDHQRTLATTFETLMAARELKIPNFIFASTSAVYGANPAFPTPENAGDMHPVSLYGAGKLASEAFISSFVENYGISAWVFRFGNVVGRRLTHGVIYDFTARLRKDPAELVVLGNGGQTKTYVDVEDLTSGILHGFEKSPAGRTHAERFQVLNLSTEGTTSVREIAEETVKVVTGGKAKIRYGTEQTGWVGDVRKTSLEVSRIQKLGWKPAHDSTGSVFKAIRDYNEWSR